MFRFALFITTTLLFSAAAPADNFRDFRIPEHKVHQWIAEGNFSLLSRGSTYARGPETSSGSINSHLSSSGKYLIEIDRRRTRIQCNGDLLYDHGNNAQHGETWDDMGRVESSLHGWHATEMSGLTIDQSLYPTELPLAIVISAEAAARFSQSASTSHYNVVYTAPTYAFENRSTNMGSWTYDYQSVGQLQLGVGRIRDATGIYNAYSVCAGNLMPRPRRSLP